MDKLAGFLIEKETITGKEFMKLLKEVKQDFEEKPQPSLAEEVKAEEEHRQMPAEEAE